MCVFVGRKEKIRRPKTWKHPQPISRTELTQMREEFWDTAPHYGGKKGDDQFYYIFCNKVILFLYVKESKFYISMFMYI